MKKNIACAYETHPGRSNVRFVEIGAMLILILAGYRLFGSTDLFQTAGTTDGIVGFGTVFLIGLTASFSSCLAMVGGLLLSISATWNSAHPEQSRFKKFIPLLQFNVGRIGGYFLLGGLTGLLGRSLVLSVKATGMAKIALSLVMIALGLHILNMLPKSVCRIPLPKFLWKRLQALRDSRNPLATLILGAATYFVPCGFTQSMQLLALGSGNFWTGALIMTMFSLGTLPSLLGISAASMFAEGRIGKLFFTFAGTLSVFLGVLNVQSGLALTGAQLPHLFAAQNRMTDDPNVTIDRNGQQIISVEVDNSGYSKNAFTIDPNKSTWIYATAPKQLSGCLSGMTIPDFNVSKPLHQGENWVGPIKPTRDFAFMCSMGMFRADVHVRS